MRYLTPYQQINKKFIHNCPQSITRTVAPAKNGPKGICDLRPFLPKIIRATPTTAPDKKARKSAAKILGQPKINPIKKANLTSPIPIQRPFETRTSARKNPLAPKAAKRKFKKLPMKIE